MAISVNSKQSQYVRRVYHNRWRRRAGLGGLINARARANQVRWFDPTVGRWLSEDPSGLGPDADPYRYCGNEPTNGADPSGLDPFEVTGPHLDFSWLFGNKPPAPAVPAPAAPAPATSAPSAAPFSVGGEAAGQYVKFDITTRFGWGLNNQNVFYRPWFWNSESWAKAYTPDLPNAISNLVATGHFSCNALPNGDGGTVKCYVTNLPAGVYDVTYWYHVTLSALGKGKAGAVISEGNTAVLDKAVNSAVGPGRFDSDLQRRTVQVTVGADGKAQVFKFVPEATTPEGACHGKDRGVTRAEFGVISIERVTPAPLPPPTPSKPPPTAPAR